MVTEQQQRRWRFLEDNRALTFPGWLPPADDVPALADLREAHERILAQRAETVSRSAKRLTPDEYDRLIRALPALERLADDSD